ncbi:MAG: hypothetical protein MK105_13325 [Crocinitomicaceae bacterium]|nr:hypothetical protein [Crocinitomicaceae bacterium]
MKTKKVRGHRRRWSDIDRWVETHKNLNLEYLKEYQRDYAKIRVHPWSGVSLTNSQTPEPTRQTKTKILSGLIEIYDSWKNELDKLGENYYLKIWLFEPRFASSQVVCALGDYLDFYENTFYKPEKYKKLDPTNYGLIKDVIANFNWEYRLDEDHFDNSEPGDPELYATLADYEEDKRWYEKMLKKPHRTTKFKDPIGEATESYSFKKGNVWLGEK